MSIEFFLEKEKAQIALLSSQLDEFKEMLKNSKAELSLLLAGMAPPPVGTAADVASLTLSLGRRAWGDAFWDMIGLAPVLGDGIKISVKGGKLADTIAGIEKAINKAQKKIADKAKNAQKNAEKKCKELTANKKKKVEDRLITKNCGTAICLAGEKEKNPHSGLHNRDDLALDKQKSFKPIRKVDMDNLSEADTIAQKALRKQGWDDKTIKQILSSGESFRVKDLKKGDKLYGFSSDDYKKDVKNSAYWLDEEGYQEVKEKFYKQGHWDKEGVKNHLALPCYNKANHIDQAVLTESHTTVESTIGKATEMIQYKGEDGYNTSFLGKIMRGGGTQIANDPTKIKSIPQ
ncbi:MAG: hypothetical protein ACKE51_08830 [Methylococcaceae bacterium]